MRQIEINSTWLIISSTPNFRRVLVCFSILYVTLQICYKCFTAFLQTLKNKYTYWSEWLICKVCTWVLVNKTYFFLYWSGFVSFTKDTLNSHNRFYNLLVQNSVQHMNVKLIFWYAIFLWLQNFPCVFLRDL